MQAQLAFVAGREVRKGWGEGGLNNLNEACSTTDQEQAARADHIAAGLMFYVRPRVGTSRPCQPS